MRNSLKFLDFRLPGKPLSNLRTRFAPSPTGYLHLGHVASAIWVWVVARQVGAQIDLRIEDHDQSRCRSEYEKSIVEDLLWLGLVPDRGLLPGNQVDPKFRQSSHLDRYESFISKWLADGRSYYCQCSRKEIADEMANLASELKYSGKCRALKLDHARDRGVRLNIPLETQRFEDAIGRALIEQVPADQCGDLLLRERGGHFSYQYCVVVDDWLDEINLVIRGTDLLDSTARQIQLGKILGRREAVVYGHHPVIVDNNGKKLSKRDRSESIASLRERGFSRENVLGRVALMMGLQDEESPRCLDEFKVRL